MIGCERMRIWGGAAAAVIALVALAACSGGGLMGGAQPEPAPVPQPAPAPPAPPPPPPVDLAGRWRLSAAAGGACFMALGDTPGAIQGTIAPEGGCPGSFYTSRKWTFEDGTLIIRNHKSEKLGQVSYTGDRFNGQDTGGGAISLSR
jgi:hypothetical protein